MGLQHYTQDMSKIPFKYNINVMFYTKYTHPTLICRETNWRTDARTDARKIFTQYSGISSCSLGSADTTKRGESIPTSTPIILQSPQPSLNASSTSHRLNNKANKKVKKKISCYSKQKILNIFDNPEQSNKEEYQEFIAHVGRLANQQIEREEREREREREVPGF